MTVFALRVAQHVRDLSRRGGQRRIGKLHLLPERRFVHGAEISVRVGMALDADKAGGRQLVHLLLRHLVLAAHGIADDKDGRLGLILFQQRIEHRVIVVISVVEGQNDRLFIVFDVRKV